MAQPAKEVAVDDALMAVVAHGLLGSLAVCMGAVRTVLAHHDLADDKRADLLEMATDQMEHMAEVLKDLMRGLPAAAREALDSLNSAGWESEPEGGPRTT